MRTALVAVVVAQGTAFAEPAPRAADLEGEPLPGQESGQTVREDESDGAGRSIGRAALWLVRLPYELVMQPVRGLLYVEDRFHASQRFVSLFYTGDRRLSVFPTLFIETGFGLNAGVRAAFRDILGQREKASLRAGYGGRTRTSVSAAVSTGDRLGSVEIGMEGAYEVRDRERFFGYGNGDDSSGATGIDPLADDTSVSTRFHLDALRLTPSLTLPLPAGLRAKLSASWMRKEFDSSSSTRDVSLEEAYDPMAVPGFATGTRYLYSEVELAWDTRREAHPYDARGMYGTGGLVMLFGGPQTALDDGISFVRAGFDLQRHVAITRGPRALQFRAYGEMVTGPRDEVPFTELPRLGGRDLLRGYQADRFRDRVAVVGQVSYLWALGRTLAASLSVDVGRVYESLDAVTAKDMRVGYGIGLQGYAPTGMVGRLELASSIDGGLFVYLALNPTFDARSRVERL
jgi:hypothetical protein